MPKRAPKLTKEEQEREDRKKSVYHDKSSVLVKKNIRNVQVAFGEFSTVGFMGEQQFEVFAQEMNLPSHDITRRLFMAFDDDNTGALDNYEFFLGLRAMNGYIADADHIDRFAFTFFNTELVDGERDDVINMKEIENFLLSFHSEACDLTSSNLHQFENIFGPGVASVAVRGLPHRVPLARGESVIKWQS